MKAKELANILLLNPEYDIVFIKNDKYVLVDTVEMLNITDKTIFKGYNTHDNNVINDMLVIKNIGIKE